VGAAAVMRDNVLLGIVTERDMINKVLDHGLDPRDVPVERIMSRHLTVVSPEDSLKDCVRKLRLGHFRHLPVVEEGEIIGMISVRDILGADAGEQLDRYLWDREGRS
jgi:CBS domain-containing protein